MDTKSIKNAFYYYLKKGDYVGLCSNNIYHLNHNDEFLNTFLNFLLDFVKSGIETECIFSVDVINQMMINCNNKVKRFISQKRILERFVVVFHPSQTSPPPLNIKNRIISFLYTWSTGMPHLNNFKHYYNEINGSVHFTSQDTIMPYTSEPSRASFETTESVQLLSKLINSKQRVDTEYANRYIKLLIESENKRDDEVRIFVFDLEAEIQNFIATMDTFDFDDATNREPITNNLERTYEKFKMKQSRIEELTNKNLQVSEKNTQMIIGVNEKLLSCFENYRFRCELFRNNSHSNIMGIDVYLEMNNQSEPRSYYGLSIITVLIFFVAGVPGLIYSIKSKSCIEKNEPKKAKRYGRIALYIDIIGLGLST
ncbi:hypothetical protein A3Q56_00363 [Intoshia linei]|uniref:VHS domain-containing protein n=1 Tax=Intoshia linei TaxID=1819745 RepID=A0A177BCE3_9BILA|nr:hypothetical protein A3Q56_00363 [Intoshia linei]